MLGSGLDIASVPGSITEAGLRGNIDVALRYLEAWLGGNGAVGIHNLMEDAATAEISRSQVWQWVHNSVRLDTGRVVTPELVRAIADEELSSIAAELGDEAYSSSRYPVGAHRVRAGGAGRRIRRLPHPAGLRGGP